MTPPNLTSTPCFDDRFRAELDTLLSWRRDVRRFRRDLVPRPLLAEVLQLAQLSPSVGNSQPWRFVEVASPAMRAAVKRNFAECNAEALADQAQTRARLYARLKLEGLDAAPAQLAVFCDHATTQGHGLGAKTMPEALDYSVAAMIAVLWLSARAGAWPRLGVDPRSRPALRRHWRAGILQVHRLSVPGLAGRGT